jgi:hypothetical protein
VPTTQLKADGFHLPSPGLGRRQKEAAQQVNFMISGTMLKK